MKNDAMMKQTAVLAALFAAVSVSVMLLRLTTRTVLVADAAQNTAESQQMAEAYS